MATSIQSQLTLSMSTPQEVKFWWQHDQILTLVARKKPKQPLKGLCFIQFLRSGESVNTEMRSKGVLATANDW